MISTGEQKEMQISKNYLKDRAEWSQTPEEEK
jgi:hypothetical protein